MKVPQAKFDIIDAQNSTISGDVICANSTNIDDCDLYFLAKLRPYKLSYFKLIPNKIAKKTNIIEP